MNELTITLNSLSLAFQTVKENHGCAGVDGVTIEQFEGNLGKNLKILQNEIKTKTYFPLPLLKILVDKGNGESRALYIPTVRDRIVQTAALKIVEPVLEKEFEECSFAYRKGRSVKQAVYKIREYYDKGYHWVVDADIDAFFDSVDHDILIEKVKRLIKDKDIIRLINMWLKAEVWDGKSVERLEKGISQGSAVSPILANLFLDKFDEELIRNGHKLVRFSDDFVILCRSPADAKQSLQLSKEALDKLLLELDEEQIISFEDGFKFLGVIFIRDMIMTPFDRPKRERKILSYPKPLNMNEYFLKREIEILKDKYGKPLPNRTKLRFKKERGPADCSEGR